MPLCAQLPLQTERSEVSIGGARLRAWAKILAEVVGHQHVLAKAIESVTGGNIKRAGRPDIAKLEVALAPAAIQRKVPSLAKRHARAHKRIVMFLIGHHVDGADVVGIVDRPRDELVRRE